MIYYSNYPYLDPTCIGYINSLIAAADEFDIESFNRFIQERDIPNKNKPSAYLRAIFLDELKKGTFKKVESETIPVESYNYIGLYNYMREKGIEVKQDDTVYIEVLTIYLISKQVLKIDDLRHLNRKCVNYIAEKIKAPTTADFIKCIKNSNTLKNKGVDWITIEQVVKNELNKWKELIGNEKEEI